MTGDRRHGLVVSALLLAVRCYRLAISPLLPPLCRYEPSCSRYADEALRVHGAARGSWLAFRRLLRCRPGGARVADGGCYDPVPPPADSTEA